MIGPDLSTTYLGLKVRNPIVASSSPLTKDVNRIMRLEEAGIGAVVLPSLFEEEIEIESYNVDQAYNYGSESYSEALDYLPDSGLHLVGPDEYLKTIQQAKEYATIPIIASLNGISAGGWSKYAKLIEQAGADAIELNIYALPTNPDQSALMIEQTYRRAVRSVMKQVSIPVAVKISPYFTGLPNMARQLSRSKVAGIVLFNRFYQPDFDLNNLDVVPNLVFSRSEELRLPLTWTAILYKQVPIDLAITTGVHTHFDVIKAVMAGAQVAMMASELLENGTRRINEILADLQFWMEEREYLSIDQMRGSMSYRYVSDPSAFERANYIKVLHSFRFVPSY